jgi:hypothetical protein
MEVEAKRRQDSQQAVELCRLLPPLHFADEAWSHLGNRGELLWV